MIKITKSKLSLVLVIMLVLVVALSGCGGSDKGGDGGAGGGGEGPWNYGINTWGAGVPILDMFGDVEAWTIEVMGDTYVRASDDFTADKEVQNVKNFISQGVDGIILQAAAASSMPQIAEECANAKVPFVLSVFIGDDPDVKDIQANNDMFVGAIDSDMVYDGFVMGEQALANGAKTACIIGGNIGDNNMDQRIQGFTESFEAGGGKILAEARCTDASEAAKKAEDMLSANKDVDALYALVGDYIPGSMTAMENLKLNDIKVYVSCVDEGTANLIKDGKIVCGNDGISLSSFLTPTLMRNYLDGNQILDDSGKPPVLRTKPFIVDANNAEAYLSVFFANDGKTMPFTPEMIEKLLVSKDSSVNFKTYTDLIENGLQLNNFLEANGKPTV